MTPTWGPSAVMCARMKYSGRRQRDEDSTQRWVREKLLLTSAWTYYQHIKVYRHVVVLGEIYTTLGYLSSAAEVRLTKVIWWVFGRLNALFVKTYDYSSTTGPPPQIPVLDILINTLLYSSDFLVLLCCFFFDFPSVWLLGGVVIWWWRRCITSI